MPATLLISVDLPAPLSPTSAITSPARTSKSASRSAWTDPKLLEIPRSSRVGGSGVITAPFSITVEALRRAPLPLQVLLAVLLVLADADLALLQEAFLEEERVVLLRDPDGRQQDRLRALELRDLARHLPVLDERDRDVRGRLCLEADRLVDGAGLPAREDELDAGRRGVLTRKRDGLQAVRLQRRHHRAGKTVVRREDAVDLVAVAGEHLVEDLPTLDRIPIRPLVTGGRLFEGAVLVERVEDRVVTLLEQMRVVVGRAAVQLGDDRVRAVLAPRLQAVDEARALQLADADVVERHVVRGLAADDEAVVVDDLRALADGEVRDRVARRSVDLVEQDHLCALGQALLCLRLLLLWVIERVQHLGRDIRLAECGLEVRRVEQDVARRRLCVRQEGARLDRRRLPGRRAGARRRCGGDQPDEDGRGEGRDRPAGKFLHVSSFDDETRWYVRTTPVVTPTSETWETRLC